MTTLIPLSETAKRVCAEHWAQRKRCGGCPIQRVCEEGVQPLTYAALNRHTERVNAAAAAVERNP
jgi:hypothetical protein